MQSWFAHLSEAKIWIRFATSPMSSHATTLMLPAGAAHQRQDQEELPNITACFTGTQGNRSVIDQLPDLAAQRNHTAAFGGTIWSIC